MNAVANKKLIALGLPSPFYIGLKFYKSKAARTFNHEFVKVTIGEQSFVESIMGVDGVAECIGQWLAQEIQSNPSAQAQALKILNEDAPFTGTPSLRKVGDQVEFASAGENSDFQLMRALGLEVRPHKSSSRKNASLVGYWVTNKGIPS